MKKSLGAKTLVYPTPVFVVGTYDVNDKPNVLTASWAGICCSQPPCVAVSLRKATATYGNIVARKAFTISIPSEAQVQAVGLFWTRFGEECGQTGRRQTDPGAEPPCRCPLRERVSDGCRMQAGAYN